MNQDTMPILSAANDQSRHITGLGLGFDQCAVGYAIGSRNKKTRNEDNYWPHEDDVGRYPLIDYFLAGRLYIVADGVSGGLSGDVASELATKTIANSYYDSMLQITTPLTQHDIERALKSAIMAADQALLKKSDELREEKNINDEKSFLQTTVICLLLRGQTLTIANVGDSHIYSYHNNHTELLYEPKRAAFVGINLHASQISVESRAYQPEELLILCSDGLYNYLTPQNNPKHTPELMTEIFGKYYPLEGINGVSRELLETADDANSGGGGDNITVMLVKASSGPLLGPHPLNPPAVAPIMGNTQVAQLIREAWFDLPRPNTPLSKQPERIRVLAEECHAEAEKLGKESREAYEWRRRANQLGASVKEGAAELEEAQTLYQQLELNFESNQEHVQKIVSLYTQARDNPDLARLTLDAVVDLANTALLAPQEQTVKAAYDLLYTLGDLFEQIEKVDPEAAQKARKIRDELEEFGPHPPEKSESPSPIIGRGVRGEGHEVENTRQANLAQSNDQTPGWDNSLPAVPGTAGDHKPTPRAQPFMQRFGRPLMVLTVFLIFAVVASAGLFVRTNSLDLEASQAEISAGIPTSATITSTITAESAPLQGSPSVMPPTSTVPPTTASQAASEPVLTILNSEATISEAQGVRKKIKLSTSLSVETSSPEYDANAIIEVETRFPLALSAIGGEPIDWEIMTDPVSSETIVTQQKKLTQVNPEKILFELLNVVDSPHSQEWKGLIVVTARLKNAEGTVLNEVAKEVQVGPLSYNPALSVEVSPVQTLVTNGDLISFTVVMTNTGDTWIDKLVFKPEESQLKGLEIQNWQAQLDAVGQLTPKKTEQITLIARVTIDQPQLLTTTLAIDGMLGDNNPVLGSRSPIPLQIYAKAKIVPPPEYCTNCLPETVLTQKPDAIGQDNPEVATLPLNLPVKVLDAVKAVNSYNKVETLWYLVDTTTSDNQSARGWLWSERVGLDNAELKGWLEEKANQN